MIKFFSTGYLARYFQLLLLSVILWLPSLLYPIPYTGIPSFAYNQISSFFNENLFLLTLVSFILTLLTALILNKIAVENGLSSKISSLVAFLYIFLTSAIVGESHNNPVIWINFILVFALANILRLQYANNTIPVVFNASFLLGIASLFYSQLVFLIVFIWASIIIHRVVEWRNFVVTLIGVVLPYAFLLTWLFFIDNMLENSFLLFDSLKIDMDLLLLSNPIEIIVSVILFSLIIVSVFGIVGTLNEKNINLRRNLIVILFYFISSFLILFFFSKSIISTLLMSIPSALMLANWLIGIKRVRWFNIALFLVMLLVILNQFLFFYPF